MALIYHRFC